MGGASEVEGFSSSGHLVLVGRIFKMLRLCCSENATRRTNSNLFAKRFISYISKNGWDIKSVHSSANGFVLETGELEGEIRTNWGEIRPSSSNGLQ